MSETIDSIRSAAQGLLHDITATIDELRGDAPHGDGRSLDAEQITLETDGSGTIAVYRDLSGEGSPVLLVHSVNAAASAYEMRPLFDHYRGQRPVYAVDLPGFGASSRDAAEYTPERFAAAIERVLIDVVGAEKTPATVVALSLSSEFVARVASRSPSLVRAVAYISPTGMGRRQAEAGHGPLDELRQRFFKTDAIFKPLFKGLSIRPSVRYFLSKSFEGAPPADLVDHAVEAARAPGAWHAPAAFLSGSLFTPDAMTSLYQKVTAPQLVIYGEDPYTDFGAVSSLLAARPGAVRVEVLPTRGMAHWDHTREVTDAIARAESDEAS